MKSVTILLCVIAGSVLADDKKDAGDALYRYFDAFNAQNIELIATTVYATPVQIGGASGHRILADPAAAKTNLENLYASLATQGWVESRISDLNVCVLSASLALVDTRYARIDADGNAIPPAVRTTLYIAQKIDDAWRIVAFYGHDPDQRPECAGGDGA